MNVLEVYASFLPMRGGVERHIYDLCTCLTKRGCKPVVFAWDSPKLSLQIIDGLLVRRVYVPHFFRKMKYPMVFYLCLQIAYSIRKYNITLIHAHDYLPGVISALVTMFLRRPLIVTFHLPISRTSYTPLRCSPMSLLEWVFKKVFISRVAVIICVSKFTCQETMKLGFPDLKLQVIHNWVTPFPKCEIKNLDNALKKFDLDGKHFIFSVGRLVDEHKGFSMLISALQKLIKKGYNMDLAIVGEGPDREMLIKYSQKLGVEDKFHLLGGISDRDLACLYKECDIFVLPSRFEAFGLVLVEAMSFGKPIVATKVGGVPEVVEDGHSGLLVDPNPDSIASGIETVLTNPNLRETFEKRSREIVRKFSIHNCYATINLLETASGDCREERGAEHKN